MMRVFLLIMCLGFVGWLKAQEAFLDSAKQAEQAGNYQLAEGFTEKALTKQKLNDSIRIQTLLSLARLKRINQKFEEGLTYMQRAERLSDSVHSQYFIWKVKIQLGDYYRAIGAEKFSYDYFRALEADAYLQSNPVLLNQFYHRKAASYNEWETENPQDSSVKEALVFSKQALAIANEHELTDAKATSYNEIANIFEKRGRLEQALTYYDSASAIFEANNLIDYVNASRNIIRVYYSQGNYKKCISEGKRLLQLTSKQNWPDQEYPILHYVARSYFALGDSIQGYKYDLLNKDKLIETNEQRFLKEISQQQVQFDMANKELQLTQKEGEIEQAKLFQKRLMILLALMVLLIAAVIALYVAGLRKNRKLEALLKENAFLIGEANHRIKNNLQLIVSLLSKEIRKADDANSQQLMDVKAKIESISTLHQQLYLNEDKSTIDIDFYLREILNNMESILAENQIEITQEIKSDSFPIEKALHLGLLQTELLINAVKHAFDDASQAKKLSIELKQTDAAISYSFKDNGKGLPSEKLPKLVRLLSVQLKGKVQTINKEGFNFRLDIPI